jgi:hypothetical protein
MRRFSTLLSFAACLVFAAAVAAQGAAINTSRSNIKHPSIAVVPTHGTLTTTATDQPLPNTMVPTGTTGDDPVKKRKHSYKGTVTLVR